MKLAIVGDGVFGTFLKKEIKDFARIEVCDPVVADTVILAVPYNAYEEVCAQHAGKHLVNVCSIQAQTTAICMDFSKHVTSIHPMFGPNSGYADRFSILTHATDPYHEIIGVFQKFSRVEATTLDGEQITPIMHDQIMAKTHVQAVKIGELIKKVVDEAEDIPGFMLPASFLKLRMFRHELKDISEGTRSSILANLFAKDNE